MGEAFDLANTVEDFLVRYREAKTCVERFVLWPRRWRNFAKAHGAVEFVWSAVPFEKASRDRVPEHPGVYTFSIEPRIASHPGASFLMYVGKAEHQTLRRRFEQYLREKDNPKGRGHIHVLLNEYDGYLTFHCAACPAGMRAHEAEQALQAGFVPPFCKVLPAEVSTVRRAFS